LIKFAGPCYFYFPGFRKFIYTWRG